MKRISYRRLVAISAACGFFLFAARVDSARRPRYGGTLRVEIGSMVSSLDPEAGAANPEEASAKAELNALLYEARDAKATDASDRTPGAFRMTEWEPGKHAVFVANENYRAGRPFVDSIAIQMGRTSRDRLLDLELNKTDFAEIPVDQVRLATERGVRVSASKPAELLAVIFTPGDRTAQKDPRVREVFSRAIDRAAVVNFILQKQGEPAGGLLPQWSSGTAFLFSTESGSAQEIRQQIGGSPRIALGYDSGDTLEQAIAERISVNAREAGIFVTTEAIPADSRGIHDAPVTMDARFIRWKMPSPDARESLAGLLNQYDGFGATDFEIPEGASAQQMYERELAAVNSFQIVPLAWIPRAYGVSARVRDWVAPVPGDVLPLADVWLDGEAP
jgi:hypothetical protein